MSTDITSPPPTLQPGDRVDGRYEIVRPLGEGGFGQVYEARHLGLDRLVALKIIRAEIAYDGVAIARFQLEARTASRLRHPNIVEVIDFGGDAGRFFLAMELLHGEGLQSLFQREGPLSPARLLALIGPVADALDFAHRQGVVHRDVKPDNIMLVRAGDAQGVVPRLVDFGIARQNNHPAGFKLTGEGMMIGTPAYMAPEQVWAQQPATALSDQWSFAAVLYEGLTGHFPHECKALNELVMRRSADPVEPLTNHVPSLPRDVCEVIERALSVTPADRYPSMQDLRNALDRSLASPSATPLSPVDSSSDDILSDTMEDLSRPSAARRDAPIPPRSLSSLEVSPAPLAVAPEPVSPAPPALGRPRVQALALAVPAALIALAIAARVSLTVAPSRRLTALPEAPAASPREPAPRVETPAPAPEVVFTIHVRPDSARILLDGRNLGAGHAVVRRPRGAAMYSLRLESEGFEPFSGVLRGDSDAQVSETLAPVAQALPRRAPAAPPASRPPTAPQRPHAQGHRNIDRELP